MESSKEVGTIMMRKGMHNKLKKYTREEQCLLNKRELARRFNFDSRRIDRYLKINSRELEPKESSRIYKSLIDDYNRKSRSLLWKCANLLLRKA